VQLTLYGQYDVLAANSKDWHTDPFELNARDGYLYARGASANKGPVLAMLFAVKRLLAGCGPEGPGLNLTFIFEGEAENTSTGFLPALAAHQSWFAGSKLVIATSTTTWIGEKRPCLTYGTRGMINLSVRVQGPLQVREPCVFGPIVRLSVTLYDPHPTFRLPVEGKVKPFVLRAASHIRGDVLKAESCFHGLPNGRDDSLSAA
jgi:hypothetical protein